MYHIGTLCHAIYANAFDYTHRNIGAAYPERQICYAKPISIQEECGQVNVLQPIAAVHGICSSCAVNPCSGFLTGGILFVLVKQLYLEETPVRSVIVRLVIIIIKLFG